MKNVKITDIEIKDNDLDKNKLGIAVYMTLHKIPNLFLDELLDLIYNMWRLLFASGADTIPSASIRSIKPAALL